MKSWLMWTKLAWLGCLEFGGFAGLVSFTVPKTASSTTGLQNYGLWVNWGMYLLFRLASASPT